MSDKLPEDVQQAFFELEYKRSKAISSIFSSIAGFISVCSILLLAFGIVYLVREAFGG